MKIEKQVRLILKRHPKGVVDDFIGFCEELDVLDVKKIEHEKEFSIYYQPEGSKTLTRLTKLVKQIYQLQLSLTIFDANQSQEAVLAELGGALRKAKSNLASPILHNEMIKTQGSPTTLSVGEIQLLFRLQTIYYSFFPNSSPWYNNRTNLRAIGEVVLGKEALPKKIDSLIARQSLLYSSELTAK